MKKNETTAIKGIAILLMIFYHLFYGFSAEEISALDGIFFSGEIFLIIAKACHVCVPLFVFVTGYGLAISEKENETLQESGKAAVKRYFRLVTDLSTVLIFVLFVTYAGGFEHTAESVWGDGLFAQISGAIFNVLGIAGRMKVDWFCSAWWYAGLAVFWIFFVPLLCRIVRKIGLVFSVALAFFLPGVLGWNVTDDTMGRYFPVLVSGIIFAVYEVDIKIVAYSRKSRKNAVASCVVAFTVFAALVFLKTRTNVGYLVETGMALAIVGVALICLFRNKVILLILEFFGKYSKYMWLLHVFIMLYWFKDFVYSPRNIWLIYGVTIGCSLLISIILQVGKGYLLNCRRKKMVSSKGLLLAAFLITAGCFLTAIFCSEMVYLTNDDGSIQSTLSGYLTGTPYPFHQFINVTLGYMIAFLYRLLPGIQWWYAWSLLLLAVGIFLTDFVLLKMTGKYLSSRAETAAIMVFVNIGFFVYFIGNVSFTIVPAVLGVGLIAVVWIMADQEYVKQKKLIFAGILIGYIALFMHRKSSGLVVLCYLLLAFLYYFVNHYADWRVFLKKFCITAVIFLTVTVVLSEFNQYAQNRQNGEKFVEFNSARSQFMDYPHDSYEENPELFQSVGWDEDTYELVSSWCFLDENVTAENFRYLSENSINQEDASKEVAYDVFKSDSCRPVLMLWIMSGILGICVFFFSFQWKRFVFFLFNNMGTVILIAYQILEGRALYRSIVIVLLPAFVINWLIILRQKAGGKSRKEKQVFAWSFLVMGICCLIPMLSFVFDQEYNQNVCGTRERGDIIYGYFEMHPENVYVTQNGVTNNIDPWRLTDQCSNSLGWGGSTYYSGEYFERLQTNGFEEFTGKDFSRDSVYFVSSTMVLNSQEEDAGDNLFGAFYRNLKKEYGAVGFVLEDQILDGVYVYHFVFENNLSKYPVYYDIINGDVVQIQV